ncbi:MAG: GMP/IMP nucleotidase [Porticoccaceae bacterium]|nr:GMP/IMP nucleotidase [Porticoccaceae bacterium]
MLINWDKIDTVLLDMDGTLLDLHFDSYFWLQHLPLRYSAKFPGKESEARRFLANELQGRRGTLDWYCTDFWSSLLDLDIMALKREVMHLISERPQTPRFLQALGAANKKRILATNAHPNSVALKFSVTSIQSQLDAVATSHDYGYPKESPFFWRAFQEHYSFDLATTLFIDDSTSVLTAARNYGIEQLLCINMPDSQRNLIKNTQFPAISHFKELLTDNGMLKIV